MTHQKSTGKHRVRPRRVWGGLFVAIVGAAVIGLAILVASWSVALAGLVLLGIGALVAWRGGALYDATGAFELDAEVRDIKEGNAREGTKAGEQIRDPDARRESRRADHTRRAATAGTLRAPRPGLSVAGAIVLLVAAAFVLSTQGMYPHTHTGQINGERDLGLAILAGLVGLRVLLSPRPHRVGVAVALLCAAGMALQAWLAPHDATRSAAFETAAAVAYVVGGLMALDVRQPRAGLPARAIDRASSVVAR